MIVSTLATPHNGQYRERLFDLLELYRHFIMKRIAPFSSEQQIQQYLPTRGFLWNSDVGLFNKHFQARAAESGGPQWVDAQLTLISLRSPEPAIPEKIIHSDHPLTFQGSLLPAGRYCVSKAERSAPTIRSFHTGALHSHEEELTLIGPRRIQLLDGELFRTLQPEAPEILKGEARHCASNQILSTLAILEEHLPHYHEWIALVLHEIDLVLNPSPNGSISGSIFELHGHIYLSASPCWVTNAIVLVHECSHQYFHALMAMRRLVRTDAPLFYSVLKNKGRPLIKVLLGYHAFVNVCVALKELLAIQALVAWHDRIAELYSHHFKLVHSLTASLEEGRDYLTESGLELYQELQGYERSLTHDNGLC